MGRVLVLAPLLLGLLIWFATGDPEPRADFTYVNPSDIHTLDPARMSWTQDFRVALNLWEGLTTSDPKTTQPIEGAAFFPPVISADHLTYTFVIRDDARWSNGDPVIAADFIRGWRRAMEPGTSSDYTFLFTDHVAGAEDYVRWRQKESAVLAALSRLAQGWSLTPEQSQRVIEAGLRYDDKAVQSDRSAWARVHRERLERHAHEMEARFADVGVRALGERLLQVLLQKPCPYFLDLTAFPTLLPCHESIERLRERYEGLPITAQGLVAYDPQWTKPDYRAHGYPGLVTNGPYCLAEWSFKRRARLAVNPYFREAAAINCRTIDMVVFENISAALMAYEAGDVDFLPAMDVPYDHELARLAMSGERPDFHQCRALATFFLNFNCTSPRVGERENPFTDPRIRRAFALATDRRQIVERVLGRGDVPARTLVPPDAITGYVSPEGIGFDPTAARALLAEAGFSGGVGFPPVEFLHVGTDERVAQALARMWGEHLGVQLELRAKESKTFSADKAAHHFMIARGNWYGDYYDPTTFLDCLMTGNGNNDSGYSCVEYDQLLRRATAEPDPAARFSVLREAEAIVVERDLPILPILHYATTIAIKPYVTGLHANPRLRFPFRYVTLSH